MIVEVLQEEFSKALSICSRFTSNKAQLPVLSNILLEANQNKLLLSSTNLEISMNYSIGAKVEEKGSITVPTKVITETLNNLKKGQVRLKVEKESLVIESGDFLAKISGMNASDFPKMAFGLGSNNLLIEPDKFKETLSRVLFATSVDETRPVLTGVLTIFGDKYTTFVATDGFRLSQVRLNEVFKNDGEKRIIIPKNAISEVMRIPTEEKINLSFKTQDNMVLFGFSNAILSSRVIDGEFPDFERIIPKQSSFKLRLDKEEFLRNIKLASVLARDSANVVKINIKKNEINILSESQQYGTQTNKMDAVTEGDSPENFLIAFNFRFLEDFINIAEGSEILIEMTEPNSPALFLDPRTENFIHIIMPVRLQDS